MYCAFRIIIIIIWPASCEKGPSDIYKMCRPRPAAASPTPRLVRVCTFLHSPHQWHLYVIQINKKNQILGWSEVQYWNVQLFHLGMKVLSELQKEVLNKNREKWRAWFYDPDLGVCNLSFVPPTLGASQRANKRPFFIKAFSRVFTECMRIQI